VSEPVVATVRKAPVLGVRNAVSRRAPFGKAACILPAELIHTYFQ
jgi:hypothetical protein